MLVYVESKVMLDDALEKNEDFTAISAQLHTFSEGTDNSTLVLCHINVVLLFQFCNMTAIDTSMDTDIRFWRLKLVSALKGLIEPFERDALLVKLIIQFLGCLFL